MQATCGIKQQQEQAVSHEFRQSDSVLGRDRDRWFEYGCDKSAQAAWRLRDVHIPVRWRLLGVQIAQPLCLNMLS